MLLRITYAVFGIAVGVLFVFWLHDFMATSACDSIQGQYQPEAALCIDEKGQQHPITITNYMLFLYGIFGVGMALLGTYFIYKVVTRFSRRFNEGTKH